MKTHAAPPTKPGSTSGAGTHRTDLVRLPWALRVDGVSMIVRPSTARDLANTAVMHHRCSARTLLGRYQLGGRPPSILAMDRQLRQPFSFVVTMRDGAASVPGGGAIVATAVLGPDLKHGPEAGQAGILVEDSWQHLGIGHELMTHLAGVASLVGYRELVAYPGLMSEAIQRTVTALGTTRMVNDEDGIHLHTTLPASASGGLGPLRAGVAGTGGLDGMGADGDELFLRRIG